MKRVPKLATVVAFAITAAACATTPAPQTMASAEPDATIYVTPDGTPVSCRAILRVGSNQITKVCGTDEQWERYETRLARAAQSFTMRLQGSAYGGGGAY